MNQLKNIQENIKKLENMVELKDKIKSMKEIKKTLDTEQENIKKLKKKIDDVKANEIKKYKNLTIDELQEMFDDTDNFEDKLNIYSQLCFKINQVENELFGKNNNSDSEEIEYDSESD
jgi:hypothetical protein